MAKNLRELGASPFPYIISVVPRSFPAYLIKGEHFVLVELFKLNPGSSSQVISAQEDQVKTFKGTLVRFGRATQPQSPRPAPKSIKKKKENRTRARQTKVAGNRLEDFMDWTGLISSEPTEEEEMSNLATGFLYDT